MAKKFPEIKEKNEGKFTKWVEKNMGGMDTCKAASKIMKSRTKKYSPAVVKMANYANNFGCKTKREDGASMREMDPPAKIKEIKAFIKKNMNKMSDSKLSQAIRKKSDNKTEYNWNNKSGKVEAYTKK